MAEEESPSLTHFDMGSLRAVSPYPLSNPSCRLKPRFLIFAVFPPEQARHRNPTQIFYSGSGERVTGIAVVRGDPEEIRGYWNAIESTSTNRDEQQFLD